MNLPSLTDLENERNNIKEVSKKKVRESLPKGRQSKEQIKEKRKPILEEQEKIKKKLDREAQQKSYEDYLEDLIKQDNGISLEDLIVLSMKYGNGDEKDLAKGDPLERVKKGLENVFTIQELKDLIQTNKNKKNTSSGEEESMQESGDNSENLMSMLPLLNKFQDQGFEGGIDPMLLMLSMGSQKKGYNNMGQIFFMMSMMNMLNKVQKKNGNGEGGNLTSEMVSTMYNEMKNLMNQQQTPQPQLDPLTLMIIKQMNSNTQQQSNHNNNNNGSSNEMLIKMFEMMNQRSQRESQLMQENWNQKFTQLMQIVQGSQRDPKQELFETMNILEKFQGKKGQQTKEELEYELKKKQLDLEEARRREMFRREDREKEREYDKENQMMGLLNTVADKVIGNGIGGLIKDVMSARSATSAAGQKGAELNEVDLGFDADDLDNF